MMISKRIQAIAVVTAAAIALTCAPYGPAFAGAAPAVKQASQVSSELGSRNRGHRYYYPRHRGNAAAAAIVGSIIAGAAAYAAAREYRKARERSYPYGYGPYGPAPYGYYPYY